MTTSPSGRPARIAQLLLLVFGLPFLAVGLCTTWMAFYLLYDYTRAKQWVETPATIDSVELKTHSGEDSSTYQVACRYHYTYFSQTYEGHRVGLESGSDNIGGWHKRLFATLDEARRHGHTVPCYVNPRNPSQAILHRELRFPMLAFIVVFATVFSCVGGALVGACVFARRDSSQCQALIAAHPEEPWRHRPDWASGTLSPRLGSKEKLAWICAIFWNLVSGPLLIFLPHEVLVRRNFFALFSLLFTAVGVALLTYAVRSTARRRKFGGSSVELTSVPGVIGGYLRGKLLLAGQVEGIDQVEIELTCTHTYTTGSGDDSTTHNDVIWSDALNRNVSTRFGDTSVELPFDFQIPYDCRPTERVGSKDSVAWKLKVAAGAPGVDLSLEFDVPVFRTPESNPKIGEFRRSAHEEDVVAGEEAPAPRQIQVSVDAYGYTQYTIPCWPGIGMFIGHLLTAAGFGGFAIFAWKQRPMSACFLTGLAIVFGLIGLLLIVALPGQFGKFLLILVPGALRVERRLGPFSRSRTIDAAQVSAIDTQKGMSSGAKQLCQVNCRMGKRLILLARNIRSQPTARWLVRRIEEHISKPTTSGTSPGKADVSPPAVPQG